MYTRFSWFHFLIFSGKVGITISVGWSEPLDLYNPDDLEASDRATAFSFGWYAHAIYINGDYPEVMKDSIREKSKVQGYNESRLPEFSDEEKVYINGMCYFFHHVVFQETDIWTKLDFITRGLFYFE